MCLVQEVGIGAPNQRPDVRAVQALLNLNGDRCGNPPPLVVDGRWGDNTSAAIQRFQRLVEQAPAPSGRIAPGSATLADLQNGMPPGFSRDKLLGIYATARLDRVDRFFPHLVAAMARYGIDTPLRQAHFLAQVGHECAELTYMEEIADGSAYEGRDDLGNTEQGDGRRFKGRGLIQLTGRDNYRRYGAAIGVDLTRDEAWLTVASDPARCADAAGWFWSVNGLNALADADDVERVTRRVNGGLNGFEDRKAKLVRAKFFLKIA